MEQPHALPKLTPQFCFSAGALRGMHRSLGWQSANWILTQGLLDFLRLSRAAVDDSITEHLNGLLEPSRAPFDTTALRQRRVLAVDPSQQSKSSSSTIPASTCTAFRERVVFPAWDARDRVLAYCEGVASAPDPDDPELALRQAEAERQKGRVVDERLDPYSGRWTPRESRTEELARRLRTEREVERIVRGTTWRVLGERCAGLSEAGGWEGEMERWRRARGG